MNKKIIIFVFLLLVSFTGCISIKEKDKDKESQKEDVYYDCLIWDDQGKIITHKFLEKDGCPPLPLKCHRQIECKFGGNFPAQKYNLESKQCEDIDYKNGAPCFDNSKKGKHKNTYQPTTTNNNSSNNTVKKPSNEVNNSELIKKNCNKVITCNDGTKFPAEEYNPVTNKCEQLIFAGGTPCFNEDLIQ